MNTATDSTKQIKMQRVSIAALLLTLLVTTTYFNQRLRHVQQDLVLSRQQMMAARQEVAQTQALLQKERGTVEGLKSCMTFDRTYIQSLQRKIGSAD
jgi:hypothetical protein